MSESIERKITGCEPKPCPEMQDFKIEHPQPTDIERAAGAIVTPIRPAAGGYPDCWPGSKPSTQS